MSIPIERSISATIQSRNVWHQDNFSSSSESRSQSEASYTPLFLRNDIVTFLVFLHHSQTWSFVLAILLAMDFCYDLYEVAFHTYRTVTIFFVFQVICNLLFMLDIISALLHICLPRVASTRDVKVRFIWAVIFDTILLVISLMTLNWQFTHQHAYYISCLVVRTLRLYRVVHYFIESAKGVGNKYYFYKTALVLGFIMIHTMGCIWYGLKSSKSENWGDYIEMKDMSQIKDPVDWYVLCIYFVTSTVMFEGLGDIIAVNDNEKSIAILMMVLSFALFIGFFVGSWTSMQIKKYRRYAEYDQRLRLIYQDLKKDCKVPRKTRQQLVQYYLMTWHEKGGIKDSELFQKLPFTLYHEVNLDIYWNALLKSHLFYDLDSALLRAVACNMHTDLCPQDDILFQKGEKITKMIYIVKGNVQILSAMDDESPVFTISAGSILGESSLIVSSNSPVQVRASGICEIQILHKCDFWRVAVKYSECKQNAYLQTKVQNRIDLAKQNILENQLLHKSKHVLKIVKEKIRKKEESGGHSISVNYDNASSSEVGRLICSDLYVPSKISQQLSDDMCVRTVWPWILRPHSVAVKIWDTIVVVTVLIFCVVYPYHAVFLLTYPVSLKFFLMGVDIIFILDIVIQIFTAVEKDTTSIKVIASMRLKQPSLIMDILAVFPLATFNKYLKITTHEQAVILLFSNRILKCHKIFLYFNKLENSFKINMALVRCCKYVVYLMLFSYWIGTMAFMLACFKGVCKEDSWYVLMRKIDDVDKGSTWQRTNNIFSLSFAFGLMLIVTTNLGDFYGHTILEMIFLILFFTIALMFSSFIISDYSAVLQLINQPRESYLNLVLELRKFLKAQKMLTSIESRVNQYLILQWYNCNGYMVMNDNDLYFDAPEHLRDAQKIHRCIDAIKQIPIFKIMPEACLNKIASAAQTYILPPNEMVAYAGEVCHECYILIQGYCETVLPEIDILKKICGPSSNFCVYEMLLVRPVVHDIRTLTHARLMRLSYVSIRNILMEYPLSEKTILKAVEEERKVFIMPRKFEHMSQVMMYEKREPKKSSWYVYSSRERHLPGSDYMAPFENGLFSLSRYFLLTRTTIPSGNFMLWWEIYRSVCAFLSGVVFPAHYFISTIFPSIIYVELFLDVSAYIDIYVRLHAGYYNSKGVLISHPLLTAKRYMTHAMITDIVACCPFKKIIQSVSPALTGPEIKLPAVLELFALNRVIQMYRLRSALEYQRENIFKGTGWLIIFICLLTIIIFTNVWTSILLLFSCDFLRVNERITITPKLGSWIHRYRIYMGHANFESIDPWTLYLTGLYWIAMATICVGFGDIHPQTQTEMWILIVAITLGYLLYTYLTVIIAEGTADVNNYLTNFQEKIKFLIKYMKHEHIDKELQNSILEHFEYVWSRTGGMKANEILKKCHLALREDSVLYLYESTFKEVPIFTDAPHTFFRRLGLFLDEEYQLPNAKIVAYNDIVEHTYIIHKGEANAIGPDGSLFCILSRGCMFGHLDNCDRTRSMITVCAKTHLDLLVIRTEELYALLEEFPSLRIRLEKYLLLKNLSYVSKAKRKENQTAVLVNDAYSRTIKQTKSVMNIYYRILSFFTFLQPNVKSRRKAQYLTMILSYVTLILLPIDLAFQINTGPFLAVTYLVDVIIAITSFYIGFFAPFINDIGETVTARDLIQYRYIHTLSEFTLDIVSTIPLECVAIFVNKNDRLYVMTWLRLNRLLRLVYVLRFFHMKFEKINVNLIFLKLFRIVINLTLILNSFTCVWWMLGCPRNVCQPERWTYSFETQICNNGYICSLYFVINVFTTTGLLHIRPRTTTEMMVCVCITMLSKYLTATFIGEITTVVQDYSFTLDTYGYNITILQNFMKNARVSLPLQNRVINYLTNFWNREQGKQMPVLLREAPRHLREEIKNAAYSKHLYENFVFVACHDDFLRQLVGKFKREIFFPGDKIAHVGDVNGSAFFIHSGEVQIISENEMGEETIHDTLKRMDCFGLIQGLFPFKPHDFTFRAATVVVTLTLEYNDWSYLLSFFPAAEAEIYERIKDIKYSEEMRYSF